MIWSQVKCPQNISGASQQNSVAVFFWTTEEAGDLIYNIENYGEKSLKSLWVRKLKCKDVWTLF